MLAMRRQFPTSKKRKMDWYAAFRGALLVLVAGSMALMDLLIYASFDP
jgi:hypothetical protein